MQISRFNPMFDVRACVWSRCMAAQATFDILSLLASTSNDRCNVQKRRCRRRYSLCLVTHEKLTFARQLFWAPAGRRASGTDDEAPTQVMGPKSTCQIRNWGTNKYRGASDLPTRSICDPTDSHTRLRAKARTRLLFRIHLPRRSYRVPAWSLGPGD